MSYIGNTPNTSKTLDANGNSITSIFNNGQNTGLATALVATDFVVSTTNTTTAQLASNASFTGGIDNIFYYQNISVLVSSDQSGTLTINQYIDAAGTQKTSSWTYQIMAGQGFSRSLIGNGNYFNLVFTNTGSATTTTLSIHTAYGIIPTFTSLGNFSTSLNEINGTTISAGQAKSAQSFPVVIASDQSVVQVVDASLVNGQSTDAPLKVSITGDESGDFAGVNILEQVVTDGTGLALNTRLLNPPKVDVNNATIPSDAPPSATLYLGVNQPQTIDTTGYQTVVFQQTGAVAVTVTQSNDGVNFSATLGTLLNGVNNTFSNLTAGTAQAIYAFPVSARYMRFQAATATSLIVYLRQTPFASFHQLGLLGMNLVSIGGTANASQAGTLTLGTTSATNGMTLGTLVTPLTVATTTIKAGAGKLYHLTVGNAQASPVYLKIYNATAVTLGTTSATLNYMIPASNTFNLDINDVGLYFSTGIMIAVTGGQALTDSTALTTASVVNYSFI